MNYLKKTGISVLMFGAIVFTSCSNSQTSDSSYNIESIQNKQKPDDVDFKNSFIVDVRTQQEFSSGHFEGAINIPLNQIENYLSEFEGHSQIVVYCRSGARSGEAKRILEGHGFTNVLNAINESHLKKLKTN